MKYLILGASGQVGQAIQSYHQSNQESYKACGRSSDLAQVDLTQRSQIRSVIDDFQPDLIWFGGALTNVDWVESNPDEAWKVNVGAVKTVVDAVRNSSTRVVFFSSDYVFNGKRGFYSEKEPVDPINQYGRQKVSAENYLLAHSRSLIIRTNCVFGQDQKRRNFVLRLIDNLKIKSDQTIPSDEYSTPTETNELVSRTIGLIRMADSKLFGDRYSGIFNISGPDLVNRYRLALEVAEIWNLSSEIKAVRSIELNRPAVRPLNGGLDCSLLNSLGLRLSNFRTNLRNLYNSER